MGPVLGGDGIWRMRWASVVDSEGWDIAPIQCFDRDDKYGGVQSVQRSQRQFAPTSLRALREALHISLEETGSKHQNSNVPIRQTMAYFHIYYPQP